jgi:hypothetical protein
MRTSFLISFLAMSLAGCQSHRAHQEPANVGAECDKLYQIYLDAGQAEARNSILEIIRIIENGKLSPQAEATALWTAYGRIFVMEKRAGNKDAAEEALVKARYWALRRAELLGLQPAEAVSYVDKYASEDGLVVFLDKWDRDHNDGRLPKYTQKP